MKTRCELIQTVIKKGIDRKNDILQEVGSTRSGSSHVSRISSMSSTTIWAQVRAEAVAAIKKAEMEKKIAESEAQWALLLEQKEKKKKEGEITFAWKKHEEESRIASLCMEQEAAVALAKVDAIYEELAQTFANEFQKPDLPLMESIPACAGFHQGTYGRRKHSKDLS